MEISNSIVLAYFSIFLFFFDAVSLPDSILNGKQKFFQQSGIYRKIKCILVNW